MTTARVPDTFRPALLPAILAAAALLAGVALIGHDWYLALRFVVAIMALIIAWYGVQAGQWWWTIVMIAIAVAWNPVFPVPVEGPWWIGAHIVAAVAFLTSGALLRVPRTTPGTAARRR